MSKDLSKILNLQAIVEQNPNDVNSYNDLAIIYYKEGNKAKALELYKKALEANPDYLKAYNNSGIIYCELQQYDNAIKIYNKALEINPTFLDTLYNLANAYSYKNELKLSIEYYKKAIELNPSYIEAHNNLGLAYQKSEEYNLAINCYKAAIKLKPDFFEAYNNLGFLLNEINDYDSAITYIKKSLQLNPNNPQAQNNIGISYYEKRQFEKAEKHYKKAIELDPNGADAYHNLSTLYLIKGDFKKGLKYYEWRRLGLNKSVCHTPVFQTPQWDGSSLKDKTIYVHYEQGDGDTLMISRYLPKLSEMGAKVIFKPQLSLENLFRQNNLNAEIISQKVPDNTIEFDEHISIMSLPLVLNTTPDNIPDSEGYLKADKHKVSEYKEAYFNNDNFKVGIFWQGNPRTMKKRAAKLSNFMALANIPNVKLYSLQKGYGLEQLENLTKNFDIVNLGKNFNDYSYTAAAIENLDLVITIDSSIAHLAGALGKPTWIMLNTNYEWRWLLNKDDSPWYKSVRLFKHRKMDDWNELFLRVATELSKLTSDKNKKFNAEDYNVLGVNYSQSGNYDMAIESFKKVVELNPKSIAAYNNLGITYLKNNDIDAAIKCYKKVLNIAPKNAIVHNNLGNAYARLEELDLAIEHYNKALKIDENYVDVFTSLGCVYNQLGEYELAIKNLEKAIELKPDNIEAYNNLGISYYETRQFELAIKYYEKAIELNPDFAEANSNLSHLYLLKGDYLKGFELYDWRFLKKDNLKNLNIPVLKTPMWDGISSLKNKTIYVYYEQGFGDTIMFARCLPYLHAMGAKVLFKPQPQLFELFKNCDLRAEIVDPSISDDELIYDEHTSLLRLPYLFKITLDDIPLRRGYLKAYGDKVQEYKLNYFNNKNFKVGIFWQGNPKGIKKRAAKLLDFLPLANNPNLKLYSLQKGFGIEQLEEIPEGIEIVNLGETFQSYSYTAAAIENLDLVITIDTSVAHLAAALGKPTWVILHTNHEWRWLLDRNDTPWYKTVRLFKQKNKDNWSELFSEVSEELNNIVANNSLITNQIEEYKNIALNSLNNSDFNNAIDYFRKMIELDSDNFMPYFYLGNTYNQLNKNNEAIEFYLKAIELNPTLGSIHTNIAITYVKENKFKQAIEHYKKSIEFNPYNADTFMYLGVAQQSTEEFDESIESIKKALELDPNHYESYIQIANTYELKEDYETAIVYYEKAINLNPDNIAAYNNLGVVYFKLEEYDLAILNYKKSLEINPDYVETYINLGVVHFLRRDLIKARECYNKAIELNPDMPEAYINTAATYLIEKNFEEGWKYYEWRFKKKNARNLYLPKTNKPLWDGKNPENKTIYVYYEQGFGDTLMFARYLPYLNSLGAKVIFKPQAPLVSLLRQSDLNSEIIGTFVEDDSFEYDAHIPLMSLPNVLKTNIDTIPYPEGYLKSEPEKVQEYKEKYFNNDKFKVGIFWQGNPKGMKKRASKLEHFLPLADIPNVKLYSLQKGFGIEQLEELPKNVDIVNMGAVFKSYSDTAAAIENLDLVITIDTSVAHLSASLQKPTWIALHSDHEWRWFLDEDTTPWYKSARLFKQKNKDNWNELFQRISLELSNLALKDKKQLGIEDYNNLGINYSKTGDFEKAVECFKKVVELNPKSIAAINNLGITYLKNNDIDEAIKCYKQVLTISPNNAIVHTNLGNAYSGKKETELAIKHYKKSIKYDPNHADAYNSLGYIYNQKGEFETAIQYLKKVIKLKPNYDEGYNNLGISYKEMKKYDLAIENYRKAISLNPASVKAYNNLGAVYNALEETDLALRHYNKAIELDPNFADAYCNLGVIYTKLNEFEKALKNYAKTLELKPENPEVYYNLGDTYIKQNMVKESIEACEKAVSLCADDKKIFNLSLSYLINKDFERGFKCYEARMGLDQYKLLKVPKFSKPRWQGESIKDKVIYVHSEQGIGDTIQFSRYIHQLNSLARKVIFNPQGSLTRLFEENNLPYEIVKADAKEKSIKYDLYTSIMSLPHYLGAKIDNIPFSDKYFSANPQLVQSYKEKYFDNDCLKIGIKWQGNPNGNKNREAALNDFLKLAEIPNVKLYSLQKDHGIEQLLDKPNNIEIVNLGDTFTDFADTAAAIENLDIIVSIDTSVAHLSAAMGKKTFILIPFVPEWRWCLDTQETSWYSNAKLFRQNKRDDWKHVIENVYTEINCGITTNSGVMS
ncbi:MAG: tetratricopeptide repeat protein [bacterium]